MKRVGHKLRDALDLEIGRRKIEGLSQHSLRAMRDAADSFCLSADPHERASAADLTPAQVVESGSMRCANAACRQRHCSCGIAISQHSCAGSCRRGSFR